MRNVAILLSTATLLAISSTAHTADFTINTGGESGAYHSQFCPMLGKRLTEAGFTSTCETSAGTTENMQRTSDHPAQLGYGQLDVLALKAKEFGGAASFQRLRMDDVRECIFAVTKDKDIASYGDVAVNADQLRFVLPPAQSGSTATFDYLREIDPYGVGRARDVIHAANTDEAIRIALNSERSVALFVQFPDPDNARFKLVRENGGHIVPVIDRTILNQRVDGLPVYFAQETQVENANWLTSGTKVVTACTPLVVFTGQTSAVTDAAQREVHQRMTEAVARLRGDDLMPEASIFAKVIKRTRELTATGAEKFVAISEQARDKAAPLFEKAREAARKAVQGGHTPPEGAPEAAPPEGAPEAAPPDGGQR
ncbi:MAG: hypothetical protein KJ587_19345 [Alphaproteobacteria bacterium]|nr:hypothetical protein [Alphaproteobacteria bacterium]